MSTVSLILAYTSLTNHSRISFFPLFIYSFFSLNKNCWPFTLNWIGILFSDRSKFAT